MFLSPFSEFHSFLIQHITLMQRGAIVATADAAAAADPAPAMKSPLSPFAAGVAVRPLLSPMVPPFYYS